MNGDFDRLLALANKNMSQCDQYVDNLLTAMRAALADDSMSRAERVARVAAFLENDVCSRDITIIAAVLADRLSGALEVR